MIKPSEDPNIHRAEYVPMTDEELDSYIYNTTPSPAELQGLNVALSIVQRARRKAMFTALGLAVFAGVLLFVAGR